MPLCCLLKCPFKDYSHYIPRVHNPSCTHAHAHTHSVICPSCATQRNCSIARLACSIVRLLVKGSSKIEIVSFYKYYGKDLNMQFLHT